MRWLLLAVVVSCSKGGGSVKQSPQSADAAEAELANVDYIYNVYKLSDSNKYDDWEEFSRLRFFTRLKLTDSGYPDTVRIALGIDPDQDGPGVDNLEEMEEIRWVVRPIPVIPLPGLYILQSSAISTTIDYNVYLYWDHANQQVTKAILAIRNNMATDRETKKIIFAEAERLPYDQAKAKEMYLERKKLSPPAEQWSILDMTAFAQMLSLYQLTGSPDKDLEHLAEENLVGETADEKLKRLNSYADKVVDNFLNTSGVHATDK